MFRNRFHIFNHKELVIKMNEPPLALRQSLLHVLPYAVVSVIGDYSGFISELVDTFPGHVGPVTHVLGLLDDWIVIGGTHGLVLYQLYTDLVIALIKHQHITALIKFPDTQKFVVAYGTTFEVWDGMAHLATINTRFSIRAVLLKPNQDIMVKLPGVFLRYQFKEGKWSPVSKTSEEYRGPTIILNNGRLITLTNPYTNVAVVGPDNTQYVGYTNGRVAALSLPKNEIVVDYMGHASSVTSLALLPDGRLVSGSIDSTIKVWSSPEDSLTLVTGSPVKAVSTFPDGKLIVGLKNGLVQVWM